MPYIKPHIRETIQQYGLNALSEYQLNAGELNYVFTTLLQRYIMNHGATYETYAQMVGILETCKMELYRRKVAEYEDFKKDVNGDAW